MKIVMEIVKFEHGTYTPRAKDAPEETWVRLVGKPVPDAASEMTDVSWLRTISYGPVADALKGKIGEITYDGDRVASLRLIVDLEGEWKTRIQQSEKGQKEVKSFVVSKFELRTGPSVELARIRRDAEGKLKEATATVEAGDLSSAYRALEEFVAGIALRGPALGNEAQVSLQDGPEERAMRAFAKADGKDQPRKEEIPVASEAKASAPAETQTIEAPIDEAVKESPAAETASETEVPVEAVAETPAIKEKAVEEAKVEEAAPPAPKAPPPRPPMAPRLAVPRRPPPPPPSAGMKR